MALHELSRQGCIFPCTKHLHLHMHIYIYIPSSKSAVSDTDSGCHGWEMSFFLPTIMISISLLCKFFFRSFHLMNVSLCLPLSLLPSLSQGISRCSVSIFIMCPRKKNLHCLGTNVFNVFVTDRFMHTLQDPHSHGFQFSFLFFCFMSMFRYHREVFSKCST